MSRLYEEKVAFSVASIGKKIMSTVKAAPAKIKTIGPKLKPNLSPANAKTVSKGVSSVKTNFAKAGDSLKKINGNSGIISDVGNIAKAGVNAAKGVGGAVKSTLGLQTKSGGHPLARLALGGATIYGATKLQNNLNEKHEMNRIANVEIRGLSKNASTSFQRNFQSLNPDTQKRMESSPYMAARLKRMEPSANLHNRIAENNAKLTSRKKSILSGAKGKSNKRVQQANNTVQKLVEKNRQKNQKLVANRNIPKNPQVVVEHPNLGHGANYYAKLKENHPESFQDRMNEAYRRHIPQNNKKRQAQRDRERRIMELKSNIKHEWNSIPKKVKIGGGVALGAAALGGGAYALHRHLKKKKMQKEIARRFESVGY